MQRSFILLLLLVSSISYGRTVYLSPNGNDSNPGTLAQPFFTLNKAWTVIAPGDTIYLRGGLYQYKSTQYLKDKNGNSSATIKVWAYPGERPVISKNTTTSFAYTWTSGILFTGNYFHWKGIEITGFTQQDSKVYTGFRISDSNNNVFEQINSHHNGHGCVITGKSSGNLVLNSDFHNNQDPLTPLKYGNADGLELCYIPTGSTNTIRGCRFWWNTDDGIDLWQNDGVVIIENTWAWNNGFIPDTYTPAGNGNGFKLGVTTVNHGTKVLRILKNCVAFNNRARGFDQNNALCSMELYNNTAYRNGTNGFIFNYQEIVCKAKNCISYKNAIMPAFSKSSIVEKNAFSDNNITTPILFDKDFVSLDGAQLMRARKSDGKLPDITFMLPAPGSGLIDGGVNVGLPFSGQAPDIGAFETTAPATVVANKPPVVSISSPLKSASFTSPATITVNATASDPDGTIVKVEFFQGSVKIGEKTTTPFSITWKDVPEGTYSLTAAATDNKNSKTVSVAVPITVVKPAPVENKLPVVSISSPAKGSSFTSPATVTINATASDPDGTIVKVEFFQGSVKIGEKTTTPFSVTWKDVPEGTYSLTAAATDNKNSKTVSAAVSITVVKPAPAENKLPIVSISSPAKGSTFIAPATVTIDAAASDPDGTIAKVEFFQGNVKIGEKATSPFSFTWKEVPEGTWSITAVATDNANSKTVSAAVSITVVKPVTPINESPIVSILSPTKGISYTAPATVTIDVNASDPDGSITKVELFNGAVKLYEKTAAPYSFTLKDLPVGSYELKAVATDNMNAIATSSNHPITVTPILEARDYFNLYPNPNDGRFSIEFTTLMDADNFTVTVVDLIGKTVYREELSKDESTRQFDLSHLNSGIYVLMIAANQILLTQKFIKG